MRNQVWDFFSDERQRLQTKLSERIRINLSSLIGEMADAGETADVLLVAADGCKLAAHACILRQRAPIFFQRYVEPTLNATPRDRLRANINSSGDAQQLVEVAVGDVDSAGLAFFIRSVYTDDEVRQLGEMGFESPNRRDKNRGDEDDDGPKKNSSNGNNVRDDSWDATESQKKQEAGKSSDYDAKTLSGCYRTKDSSPDSLNAEPSTSLAGSSTYDNGATENFVNTTLDEPFYDNITSTNNFVDLNFMKKAKQKLPWANFLAEPLRNAQIEAGNTRQIMSSSFPSPEKASRLFGDTLRASDFTSVTLDKRRSNTSRAAAAPPLMTSFRELASSRGALSCASSRCTSTQQLTTPYEESKSWQNEQIDSQSLLSPHHRAASRQGMLGPANVGAANKIFPMFINLNAMETSQPSTSACDDFRHSAAFMSRSYPLADGGGAPLHAGCSGSGSGGSGVDSGTSTIHSASLTSSSVSTSGDAIATAFNADFSASVSSAPSIAAESTSTLSTLRSRTLRARRLSVTSLSSLTSIDLTPSFEGPIPLGDHNAACQLGADLLEMYRSAQDADVIVATKDDSEIRAHRCILWASCAFFRQQLRQHPERVELKGFSKSAIHFLLSFLYGGLTCFPADEEIDVWEIIALAIHLNLNELTEVAILHLRTYKCHFFHKPCAACVSAIFDALPQFSAIKCLRCLYDEALAWQARHFPRIWKGRVFTHLSKQWQTACLDALLESVDDENVIDVLLSCEKLQLSLPRMKAQSAAEVIMTMVGSVAEYCTEFLMGAFHLVIASKSYRSHGLGLALNLSFLEDILPSLVHSFSADVAVRTFISLRDLIVDIQECVAATANGPRESLRHLSGSNLSLSSTVFQTDEWNPRFLNLNRRLFELTDRHLLHYAASVVKCEAWNLLNAQERNRISEAGIFVEMEMPRAPPPRFSSLSRASVHYQHRVLDAGRSPRHSARVGAYKRSASAGVHNSSVGVGFYSDSPNIIIGGNNTATMAVERTRSLERGASALAPNHDRLVETAEAAQDSVFLRRGGTLEKITEFTSQTVDADLQTKSGAKSRSLKERRSSRKESLTQIIQNTTNQAFTSKIPTTIANASVTIAKENEQKKCANEMQNVDAKSSPDDENSQKCEDAQAGDANPDSIKSAKKSSLHETEEMILQRQNTHTVMTMQQHRETGIDPLRMGVPQILSSTSSAAENNNRNAKATMPLQQQQQKPRSVVRPMPKSAAAMPLAIAAVIPLQKSATKSPTSFATAALATEESIRKTSKIHTKSPQKTTNDERQKQLRAHEASVKTSTDRKARSALPRLRSP